MRRLRLDDTTRAVAVASLQVGAVTAAAKVVGFAKEATVASTFGAADAVDAFAVALMFPNLLGAMLGGAVVSSLIPAASRVRRDRGVGPEQALSAATLWLSAAVGALAAGALVLVAHPLAEASAANFAPEKLRTTASLLRILSLVVPLASLAAVTGAMLNIRDRFVLAAASAVWVPAAAIVALVAVADAGIEHLAWGTIVGYLLQVATNLAGARPRVRVAWRDPVLRDGLRSVGRQFAPLAAGTLVSSGTVIVDQVMAARLASGSVAALAFGERVPAFFRTIGAMAVGTAVLPVLSRLAADRDLPGLRRTFLQITGLVAALSVPIVIVLAGFSRPIVDLLFARGAFDADDAMIVASVQRMYALQIPFYIVGILFARLLASLEAQRFLFYGALLTLVADILLNLAFIPVFGVAGIALATVGVYVLSSTYLGVAAYRESEGLR